MKKIAILLTALLLGVTACLTPVLATGAYAAESDRKDPTVQEYLPDIRTALEGLDFAKATTLVQTLAKELIEREQWSMESGDLSCEYDEGDYGGIEFWQQGGRAQASFVFGQTAYYAYLDETQTVENWQVDFWETGNMWGVSADGTRWSENIFSYTDDGSMRIEVCYDEDKVIQYYVISEMADGLEVSRVLYHSKNIDQIVRTYYDAAGEVVKSEIYDRDMQLEDSITDVPGPIVTKPRENDIERIKAARLEMLELAAEDWENFSLGAKLAQAAQTRGDTSASSPNTGTESGLCLVMAALGLLGLSVSTAALPTHKHSARKHASKKQ